MMSLFSKVKGQNHPWSLIPVRAPLEKLDRAKSRRNLGVWPVFDRPLSREAHASVTMLFFQDPNTF